MKMHSPCQFATLFGWVVFAVACFATLRFPALVPTWGKWFAWIVLGLISLWIMVFWWKTAYYGSFTGGVETFSADRQAFAWGQLLPTLLKVMVQTSLPVIALTLIYFLTEHFGQKGLPHLYGIRFTLPGMPNPQVVLPQAVFAGSLLAAGTFIWLIILAGRAYAPTSPMFLGSLAGLLIVAGSWVQYAFLSCKKSAELKKIQKDYSIISCGGGKNPISWKDPVLDSLGRPFLVNDTLKSRYRRLVEYRLGTREWNAMVFHRMADEPFGLAFRFPGYLIGVEQANRYLIGVPEDDNRIAKGKDTNGIGALLNDRRRTFVSHIVEFENRDPGTGDKHHSAPNSEMVKTKVLYNIYESPEVDGAFKLGFRELEALRNTLHKKLEDAKLEDAVEDSPENASGPVAAKGRAYTHILLFCMGWNTDQQESVRNYNSLMGFLASAAENADENIPFRPLVIGLSWPSEWSYLKPLSYLAKAGDADETGLVWGSYLLKRVLEPLKLHHKIPLVLIGHSFGARVLTRAVASQPDWIKGVPKSDITDEVMLSAKQNKTDPEIDLFIGLQGAVSANRFVKTGSLISGWWEGTPYSDLVTMRTRFIFTWSKFDSANPLAAYVTGAHHMGGKIGNDFCLQNMDSAFWPVKYAGGAEPEKRDAWLYREAGKTYDPLEGWEDEAIYKSGKVFTMDVSSIVKDQPYGKGGGAHSDIYTPEIGGLLWKSIHAFAPKNPKKPPSEQGGKSIPNSIN